MKPPTNAGQQVIPMESHLVSSDSAITEIIDFDANHFDWTSEVLVAWLQGKEQERAANRKDGAGFNPFSEISIREIDHSRLIGDLLNPLGKHGQGSLFLDAFLRRLKIPEFENGEWKVAVETGRVDIMIWRDHPVKSAILIENKSNNAIDQTNQIYRYWYEQVYLWDKSLWDSTCSQQDQDRRRRFRVIYLTSDTARRPSAHSLQCPEELQSLDLPDPLPLEVETISLSNLTKLWVNEAFPLVPEQNLHLRSFLKQYHEIWNPMNKHDIIARSVKVFDNIEKWNAIFQIQGETDNIMEHWRSIGAIAIREQFDQKPSPGWTCDEWGTPKDTRWYLTDLGPKSIGIGFGWMDMELDLFCHWEVKERYDLSGATFCLRDEEKFSTLRQIFPDDAYGPGRVDDGCFAADKHFTPYPEARQPGARRRVFAWHAAHECDDFACKILEKVRSIISDESNTALIRELNQRFMKPNLLSAT